MVVNVPVFAAVPPIAGGEARYVLKPVPDTVLDALKVVNAPVDAVVAPTDVPLIVPPVIVTDENVPVLAAHDAVVPLEVSTYPFVPIANLEPVLTPVPMIKSPTDVIGLSALNAADAVVAPVPPFAIANVPPSTIAPVVAEFGVRPVVPALNDDTPLAVAACHDAVVPLEVSTYPFNPIPNRVAELLPLPIIKSPVFAIGDSALNPAEAVDAPVPPFAIPTLPHEGALPALDIKT